MPIDIPKDWKRPDVSCIMILKNSMKKKGYLYQTIKSLINPNNRSDVIVDEIVAVIDPKTEDNTIEVMKNINMSVVPVKIILVPSVDSYSYLRNLAICNAKHDWIFSLDDDELVSEDLRKGWNGLFLMAEDVGLDAFMFPRKNPPNEGEEHWKYPDWQIRLFNRKTCYWEHRVHEHLVNTKVTRVKDFHLIHLALPDHEKQVYYAHLRDLQKKEKELEKKTEIPWNIKNLGLI